MSGNSNNQPKNIGVSSPFGNAETGSSNLPANPTLQHQFLSQSQQSRNYSNNLVPYVEVHLRRDTNALNAHRFSQAYAKAQAEAAHAQFQTQLQAHGIHNPQSNTSGSGNPGGSSSPMLNTPGNSSVKRSAPQKPPVHPPGTSATNTMPSPPLKNMELTAAAAAARKKKQKLPERRLQERVASILPESALYTQLLEFESRVDSALIRKRIDIQEAIKNPPSIQKTLRIYVFNTFANQIRTIPKKPNADPPTWTLKIVGRILEEGIDPDQAEMMQRSSSIYPKFSSFFKRVAISLDQRIYPENHIISWDSARSPAPQEGFEVKRKGDKEFTAGVRLEMSYTPDKYKLSSELMEVLGIEVDTRPRIIAAIWHYVKARKLQIPDDPCYFLCDPPLQRLFGEEKMKFTSVSSKVSHHLSPPQPIHLEHKIKLSGNSPAGNACYDVLVDVPFPIQKELNALLANPERTKEVESCDEAIRAAIRKIHEHRKRRAFFLGFAQSPVEFINALIESQSRDLKLVAGETSRSAEKERRSEFFNQTWVEDAVIRYVNRKPVTDVPGST